MMTDTHRRKLIAVDCDGTLFDGNGYPSSRTCEVVQRVVSAGHHIVAATGRSRLTACDRLVAMSGMRYVVCSNGAYAWNKDEDLLVWENAMSQRLATEIVLQLRSAIPDVALGWETRSGIGYEDTFVQLAGGIGELEAGGRTDDPWSQDIYKLYVRRPSLFRIELQREVAAVLGDGLCEVSTSGAPFVEITALGSHKASGLEKTAAMLGFTAADTIVFGDNHNDLPMFGWAGHAVAMGNALDEVKAEADAVTLANTDDGVAVYLEKLLEATDVG